MEDMDEMGTEGKHTSCFQSTADYEDTIISDATFDITSGEMTKYQSNPKIIPTIYISPTLESNIDFWEEADDEVDYEDNVTSGNSHVSTSKAVGKSISEDAFSDSQEVILDSSDNDNASGSVCNEGYIISSSAGDNTSSTIKETITVLESTAITPTGDTFYKTPSNMVVDETTVSAIPEISTEITITQRDLCNSVDSEEAIPNSGDTSGEAVDFIGTNGTEGISDSMSCTTKEGDSTIFHEEFSNNPSLVSGPDEISHQALKEISPSVQETTHVFSDNRTDNIFSENASTTTTTFSAAFQHAPSVVTVSPSDSNNTAVENTKSIEGLTNKMDTVIKEVTANAPSTVIASREMCNASSEDQVDVFGNTTSRYTATTDSGTFAIISDESMPTTVLSGESTSILSSEDVGKIEICEEKEITESENPVVTPSPISSFEYSNTAGHIAALGSGKSIIKEDNTVTDPANTSETEQPSSPRKETNSISRDSLNTTVKEILSDTTTVSSSTESIVDHISAGTAIHGNTGINMVGNVTTSCGTTTVSESVVTTSINSCGDYDDGKETICKDINHSLFDNNMITTSSGEASCQNTTFYIPGYVTTSPFSQDASGYGAKTELEKSSETTTVEISMPFGNDVITRGVTATSDVTHTIPTTIAVTEPSREFIPINIVSVLEDHSITATTGAASVFQGISSTTSEQDIITTTSGNVGSMASIKTVMIHFENDSVIASCTNSENTSVTSSTYRDSVPSPEDTVNVTYTNVAPREESSQHYTREEVPNTVPNQAPIDPCQTTIYTETATIKLSCKGSQITDASINPSISRAQEANNIMESGYRDTSIIAYDKQLTSEYSSISHVSPLLGKETSTSDLTTGIQDDIDYRRNVPPEELITPVPSPSSSADITLPISISSRSQPPLESTGTPEDKHNVTPSSDTYSAHSGALDRKLCVASTDDKNNPTSDTMLLVSGDFMPTSEPASSISLSSREFNTYDVVGDTTTNLDDSLLIDKIDSANTSPDTSVKEWYGEGNSSIHRGTTAVLGHHKSSFSVESSAQASTEQTAEFRYTTNTSEDAHLEETFAFVHNKITTNFEEESRFGKTTSSGSTTIATTTQNGKAMAEDTSVHYESNIWIDTSITPAMIAEPTNVTNPLHKPVSQGSSVTSDTSKISEVIGIPEDVKDDTVMRDIYSTVDLTIIPPSVGTSRELASSSELATTDTFLEDAVALGTVTEATSTITVLKNAATIIQNFSGNTDTVPKNELAHILHDTPQVREIISSENIMSYTLGDTKMVPDSEVLSSEIMSSAEILEDTTDLVTGITPKGTLSNDLSTDIPAALGAVSSLNHAVPIFDDGTFVSEITMHSEEILSSGNESTIPCVDLKIQNHIPLNEASPIAPGKISFSSEEMVTTISTSEAEMIIDKVTVGNNIKNRITDDANIPSSPESVTIPLDTNTSAIALQETEPLGETFISGIAINPIKEDNSEDPAICIPSEAFGTLASTPHEHNEHPFTSSLEPVSAIGETARISETGIAFENSIPAPNPFTDETDLTGDVGNTGPSKDITNITSEASTISGRMNTSESEGTTPPSVPEHLSITSEAIVLSSENYSTELTGGKCLFTNSLTSEDTTATIPEDNTADLYVLEGTNIPSHTTTVVGFGGTSRVIKNSSTSVVEIISNTQFDTSTPSNTSYYKGTSASEKTCVRMTPVVARETSTILPKRGKADTSDLANSIKGTTTTTNTTNTTSSSKDYNYISDSIPTSRGKVTAMIAIFEDVGRQNESLSSRATFSFAETSVRQVHTKSGMILPSRDVISTSSVPTKCKDAVLTPVAASTVAITQASETTPYQSKTKSLVKSDPRKRSTTSTADSVLGTVSCPRETVPALSSVILDSSLEDTSKSKSTVGTALGLLEAETSPVATSFEETHISDNTATLVDISIKTDNVDTEETSVPNVNINLGKYSSLEVKTSPEEIISTGNINTARDNFFYGAIKSSIDSFISTDVGPLSDSVSKSTVISVETATHEDVVSPDKMETSGNASFHKFVAVDITANSISSETVTFTTSSDNSPDDVHISGNIITINSEASNLKSPTAPKGTFLFEDGTTNVSIYENTSECLNNHDNGTCTPENTFPRGSEDAAFDFGSRAISPDDAVTTSLQKTSDTSTREISNTMGADLIAHRGEKPTTTHKEATPEEAMASAPWETEGISTESSTLTLEETTTATSEKTDSVTTESYMPTEKSSAISSGESGDDASGETNMVTFGKIIGPGSVESSTTSRELEDISPGESDVSATFREIIVNTKDSPEHSFSDPEELHVDAPGEIVLAQPDNITGATTMETFTEIDEASTVIRRKRSTTISSKNLPPVKSGACFTINPDEIPPPVSLGASAALAKAPKGNVPIATTSKKSHMTNPRGISSAFQEENGTIRPVVPPSYWSIMLTGIMMTLSLVAGLCMVIYYITFYILVTYSTS